MSQPISMGVLLMEKVAMSGLISMGVLLRA